MKEINLQKDTLNLLHQWLPFDAGVLFPFKQEDSSADGRIEAMLTKGGFLSQEGKLSDTAREMFSIIAESFSTSKLKFLVEGDLLDYQVFFDRNRRRAVALKRSENGFIMSLPSAASEIIEVITDFSGLGSFGTVPAQWNLSFNESIVIAAIIDLIRLQIFAALAEDEDKTRVKIELSEIVKVAGRNDLRSNWLVWALKSFISGECSPDEVEIKEAVDSLVLKNLLKMEAGGIIACDQLAITARRLLHLNCLYMLDRFNVVNEDQAEKTRLSIIQNGVRDLLLLETDGKSIAWQGISGKVMLTIIQAFLGGQAPDESSEQNKLESQPDKRGSESPGKIAEKQNVCSKCSNKLKANARFCNKCGQTVA
jgi:hypothetical protein